MTKPRIAIIVDHPLRDLPGVSLIAHSLASQGCDVFLVPMYVQERECLALAPDFVLLNYLRKNNEHFVHKLVAAGIPYGINDTEGGFYGDLSFYAQVLSSDQSLYESLSCNMVWGRKMFDFLKNDFKFKQNLIVTGLPRFDYYSPLYRKSDLSHLLTTDANKPVFLINTKVAVANPLFQSLEKEIAMFRDKIGLSAEVIQGYIDKGRESISDTIKLAQKLGQQFPQQSVVIRPHPHENDKTYREQIDQAVHPNVSVRREGPVIPWILQSKAILHRHCTTAIEAALAGKPAVAPLWVRTSANAPDAELVSHRPATPEELHEMLTLSLSDKLLPTPAINLALEQIVEDWLYRMDGLSHKRVADAILQNLPVKTTTRKNIADRLLFEVFSSRDDLSGRFYHQLNTKLRHAPQVLWSIESMRLKKWRTSAKYFDPSDVNNWIKPVAETDAKPVSKTRWAADENEYTTRYPGLSVKVSVQ